MLWTAMLLDFEGSVSDLTQSLVWAISPTPNQNIKRKTFKIQIKSWENY